MRSLGTLSYWGLLFVKSPLQSVFMTILIQNSGYHLKNLGDVSMLRATYLRLRERFPGATIQIYSTDAVLLEKYCPGAVLMDPKDSNAWFSAVFLPKLDSLVMKVFPVYRKHLCKAKIFRPEQVLKVIQWTHFVFAREKLGRIQNLFKSVQEADVLIATGGGYLTSTFFNHGTNVLLTMALGQYFGKATFFTGQGVAPFYDETRYMEGLVAAVLQKADAVGFREKRVSHDFAVKYHLDHSMFTFDDANYFEEGRLTPVRQECPVVGVNIRIAKYSGISTAIVEEFREVLDGLRSSLTVAFLAVPVTSFAGDSDVSSLRQINKGGDFFADNEIEVETVEELIGRAAQSSLMITCSYHAGVYAISNDVPTLLLTSNPYYDQKMNGLIDAFPNARVDLIDLRSKDWKSSLVEKSLAFLKVADKETRVCARQSEEYRQINNQLYERIFQKMEALS